VLGDEGSDQMNSAGSLYSKSVDLANAGNYKDALAASDQALALNVSSLMPLIQANRAGILVMLERYDEANVAADAAINAEGNITTTKSIAWFNKGNALKLLGRTSEAMEAYAVAHTLDPTLPIPEMTLITTISETSVTTIPSQSPMVTQVVQQSATTPRTPLSPIIVIGALMITVIFCWRRT
jgi:tetratricopeptide (TPR) repeat protein